MITLTLRDGSKLVVSKDRVQTITEIPNGSRVTMQRDGLVDKTVEVYEAPSRIRQLLNK